MKVISGETIRSMALIHGAKSIRKDETYCIIELLRDQQALMILREYFDGRNEGHHDEFYYNFIETRSKILEKLGRDER